MPILRSLQRATYAREVNLRNSEQSDKRCRILLDPDRYCPTNYWGIPFVGYIISVDCVRFWNESRNQSISDGSPTTEEVYHPSLVFFEPRKHHAVAAGTSTMNRV